MTHRHVYILELTFECYRDTSLGEAERAIVHYLDMLRYQGQILGGGFPTSMHEGYFVSRVVCPEQDSLHPDNQSELVALPSKVCTRRACSPQTPPAGRICSRTARTRAQSRGAFQLDAALHQLPAQLLSLRCGDHFCPIPLYRLPAVANGDHKQIIKWQEDWEACDQLQMNGSIAEHAALHEIGGWAAAFIAGAAISPDGWSPGAASPPITISTGWAA